MVLRDDSGEFIAAHTCWIQGCLQVREAEVVGILEVLSWVNEMGLKKVCFEFDAKGVVKAVGKGQEDLSEFGSLVECCRSFLEPEMD
ncbi:hypothetical protein PTKIN_Ptkin17bG0032300 [Pterospermum kingtungense]